MSSNKSEHEQLKTAFTKAVNHLSKHYEGSSLTDIFVVIDQESGQIAIFDDEQHCVHQEVISAWTNNEPNDEDFDDKSSYVTVLKSVLEDMNAESHFDQLDLFKPFSISLANDELEVEDELLVIEDESIIRIENDFMDRMDKEFDAFLEKLMKD